MSWAHSPISNAPVLRRTSLTPKTPTEPCRGTESKLSTKRERTTPRSAAPPKVVRSATSKSVFAGRRKTEEGFVTVDGLQPLSSLLYNPTRGAFFDQVYNIEYPLGKGSFGEVNAVRCREDNGLYAVKAYAVKPQNSTRHREVLSHLKIPAHPNLITFFRAWEEASLVYIQLELCQQTLLKWITDCEGLKESDVWNVSIDLVHAVNHLHQLDMIHNDIKPENVLVTKRGVCKLGDFGMVLDLKTTSNTKEEGDSKYMAPEILAEGASKSSDIFSLGLTILESAIDLDVPSNGDEWQELRNNTIPDRLVAGISKYLRGLIEAMMRREATERPTSGEILEHPRIKELKNGRLQYVEGVGKSPVQIPQLPLPVESFRQDLCETPCFKKERKTLPLNFDDSDEETIEEKENTPGNNKRRAESPLQLTPTVQRVRRVPMSPRTPVRLNFDDDSSPDSPSIRQRFVRVRV